MESPPFPRYPYHPSYIHHRHRALLPSTSSISWFGRWGTLQPPYYLVCLRLSYVDLVAKLQSLTVVKLIVIRVGIHNSF